MAVQLNQQIVTEFDVPAIMRDGTVLRANVYRPAGDGQWPVLLTRLPYGKDFPLGTSVLEPSQVARRGYVVVVQDTRGRFSSSGEWDPMRNEAIDGVDTIEWAAKLPYSTGSVGMYGASYFGFTQWSAAVHTPPALKAMIPFVTWNDPFNGVQFRGGALELGIMANWQLNMGLNVLMRRYANDPESLGSAVYNLAKELDAMGTQGYWSLPLKDFEPLERQDVAPAFFEAIETPMSRERAEPMTILGKHEHVTVPTFNAGGWYDIFLRDTISNFTIMRQHGSTPEARQSKLLIGPWAHGSYSNPVGEFNFGFGASAAFIDLQIDFVSLQVRWFDHWLKGIDNGVDRERPVRIYVMGGGDAHKTPEGRIFVGGHWRDEQEWPLARAQSVPYYLHGHGLLSSAKPTDDQPIRYVFDPRNPVPTLGGNVSSQGALMFQGAADQRCRPDFWLCSDSRPLSSRNDVLVFQTAPLEQPLEVTGRLIVKLWASSNALDTDFTAKLVDVYPPNHDFPGGVDLNVADSIVRARYRHGPGKAELLKPGQPEEFTIEMYPTSLLFARGHRIRVDISSSNFPRFDINPNTGEPLNGNRRWQIAENTIYMDARHSSQIVLPVIPPE